MIQTKTRTIATQTSLARLLPSHLVTSATIVGLGNIGSALCDLIARSQTLQRVTLIDFDRYETGNLRAQNILPRDVVKPKVQVQARKLRSIAPSMQVQTYCTRFEVLSLSEVRSDLLVSCLDSRIARTYVNEASYRLNIPLLDGAVDGVALQGRAGVFLPTADAPCLECQFSEADYAASEQIASCNSCLQTVPTNAPSALGALVAGLQAIEIQKMAAGHWDQVLLDRQVFIDLRHHKHFVTRFCRNPNCRFDHQIWNIEPACTENQPKTLADLFELRQGNTTVQDSKQKSLRMRVRGQHFIRRLICTTCRKLTPVLLLGRRVKSTTPKCESCEGPMAVSGFDRTEWLDRATLQPQELRRSLTSVGFRAGDVVTISNGNRERHFEL